MRSKSFKLVLCALFAALTCVATWLIKLPLPVVGYINLGDGVVLLGAFVLGPVSAVAAGAVGSALADILAGYGAYVIATFVIKAVMALAACLIFKALQKKNTCIAMVTGGVAAETIMVLGYLVFEMFVMGYGNAALTSVAFNAVQGVAGIAVSALLYTAIQRNGGLRLIKQ